MTPGHDAFVDASDSASATVEFPDVVASFEALGFVRLGRLGRPVPGEIWRAAALYPRSRRDEFCAHLSVPPVVLRSPDATALVTVSWWWGMPEVRLRTALHDGSVVETLRQWDHTPVPPRAHGRLYRRGDLRQEQLMLNAPEGGREVDLAQGDADQLWRSHRDRVDAVAARRATSLVSHRTMGEAVVLSNRLARHQRACVSAQKRRGLLVLGSIALVAAAALVGVFTLPFTGLLVLLVLEVAVIAVLLGFRRRIYAGSLSRRYRTAGRPALEP
ncbi:hypothetical protein [Nocardioides pocheonensis]|uniref:Uncharacterized protein n=1 Tax=Nocardioides pocheonensis TaxID=661485 RepID=A0A3N0GIW6_9ACTN|nr:hypothetical protein [Nocardioides pocheonensis]RNM12415.1 hypothetical protein EFL26_17345 [Nocardioides pocheonensis]